MLKKGEVRLHIKKNPRYAEISSIDEKHKKKSCVRGERNNIPEGPSRSAVHYYLQLRQNMPASRNWCFTENNYDGVPVEEDFGKYFRYCVYQEELGENGTPHLQGYLQLTRAVTLSAVRKMLPRANWLIAKGSPQKNVTYCTKEDTRMAGPYHMGTISLGQGERTDIKSAINSLREGASPLEILDRHPEVFFKYQKGLAAAQLLLSKKRDSSRPKEVWYLYGPPGVGKSFLASKMAPLAFRKQPNTKWWDGYAGETDVIFDDLTAGWFSWANLMQVLDRYATSVEQKGASLQLLADRIIITSNKRPWELYQDKEGHCKHPIQALLRRITNYLEFAEDGSYTDHGCPANS